VVPRPWKEYSVRQIGCHRVLINLAARHVSDAKPFARFVERQWTEHCCIRNPRNVRALAFRRVQPVDLAGIRGGQVCGMPADD
jgi:hypothetical protein